MKHDIFQAIADPTRRAILTLLAMQGFKHLLRLGLVDKEAHAGDIRFGNMAGRRIYSQLFVRYQQQSGLDFYY